MVGQYRPAELVLKSADIQKMASEIEGLIGNPGQAFNTIFPDGTTLIAVAPTLVDFLDTVRLNELV